MLHSLKRQIMKFYILKVDFKCEREFVLNPVDYSLHCPRECRSGRCWNFYRKEEFHTSVQFLQID